MSWAGQNAATADSDEEGGEEGLPGRPDEREEGVADGEQRERGPEHPAGPDSIDDRSDGKPGCEAGRADRRDDEPGGAQPDVPHVVEVDDEERVGDAGAEGVDEEAQLERPGCP